MKKRKKVLAAAVALGLIAGGGWFLYLSLIHI